MKVIMDDLRLTDISSLEKFLQGNQMVAFGLTSITDRYQFIGETLDKFDYRRLSPKDKRIVSRYLKKITGYKKAQLYRLIGRDLLGNLTRKPYRRIHGDNRIYQPVDIKLLEITDELHQRLNAHATAEIMRREVEIFGHGEFATIGKISPSHLDNLRKSPVYQVNWINGTKARIVPIGVTMKPENNNLPGSIRIDTVHQRDVYHLNAVDEITQWEIVVCVPQISEKYLSSALELLLDQFPFIIFNFHSDRGSEFLNHIVEKLLNKLLIVQTKSRSRHCNDNALVESKNGAVIRKNMGYWHINRGISGKINSFYQNFFNPYLNFHRPCGFVTETRIDTKGRERKIYGEYTTPYEKLKQIVTARENKKKPVLKPGQIFLELDKFAYRQSDNEFAKMMRQEQRKLFDLNILADREIIDLGTN